MKKWILFSVLVGSLFFHGPALALDFDFSGNLTYHNDVLYFNFVAPEAGNVTLFSSSWDDGGFDPMLGLWTSTGNLIYFQDDGGNYGTTLSNNVPYTYGTWDSYYTVSLNPGAYTITLTTFPNFNNSTLLSDGFRFDDEIPIAFQSWSGYYDSYVFHVLNVPSATQVQDVNVVPEPGTFLLVGAGFGFIALLRKKRVV